MTIKNDLQDAQDTVLCEEIKFYDENKEKFLKNHTNRHLLIKGKELIGNFSDRNAAITEGVGRFGHEPFLVRLTGEDTPKYDVPVYALGVPCQY